MNIFAYTPHEIVPPYISISKRDDGKVWVTVRSAGARDVSEIDLSSEQLLALQLAISEYFAYGREE